MISTVFTVTTTRVKIVAAAINEPRTVTLRPSGNDVFIGGDDVTDANGLTIPNNSTISIPVPQGEELWAVVSTGSHSIAVLTSKVETA